MSSSNTKNLTFLIILILVVTTTFTYYVLNPNKPFFTSIDNIEENNE